MGDKVTPQEEAKFVTTLMDTDFLRNRHWTNEDRLDYLRIVGDYADEVGEKIYRTEYLSEGPTTIGNEIKTKIGEDRPENEPSDILIGGDGLLDLLIEALKPKELYGCMSPREFCGSGQCMKGVEARAWLYANKYTHEYNHIHVFPYDLVLLLDDTKDKDIIDGTPAWIKPDGVQIEGEMYDVIQAMFHAYTEAYLEEKKRG